VTEQTNTSISHEHLTDVILDRTPAPAAYQDAQSSGLLSAALSYVERGWRVCPLYEPLADGKCSCGRPDCGSPGKHPRTRHGLNDATTDPACIHTWWADWPNANIAIVTGRDSGLVVLDVDRPEVLNGWQSDTLTAHTGKGQHFYFSLSGTAVKNSVSRLGPGLDLRGEGGYVVAPPSRHASGATYTWRDFDTDPQPAPVWLLQSNPIPEGQRNETLFRIASAMRGKAKDVEEIAAELHFVNSTRCVPPLQDNEVQKIAESSMRYGPDANPTSDREDAAVVEAITIAGMPLTKLLARSRQEPDWIIPSLLKRNNTMFIVGEPKRACKSWLLANLAWDLSEGKQIFGVRHSKKGFLFVPKRPMRVVYFSQEDAEDDFQDRAEIMARAGRTPNDNFWFVPKNLQMTLDSENGPALVEDELTAAARTAPLDLIILDPLRRVLQGDESNSERIAQIWRKLDDWSRAFNCSFIVAHHVVKPPRQQGQHYDPSSPYVSRGSSDIYAGADAFINVVPGKQKGQPTKGRLLQLHFTTKRSRGISPVSVRVNFETGGVEFVEFLTGRDGDDGDAQ
jgi:Bifunctional DNA primase/polymerase, N-terminal/AAA domain/Primase C terminal 1 (PriCT-1)